MIFSAWIENIFLNSKIIATRGSCKIGSSPKFGGSPLVRAVYKVYRMNANSTSCGS